ncbi:uncharacterized protein [Palaemon carinicauda]|uniref:uncharacterized protein n=1 Tax=Palaemon carinicauda TaxID=392227 RepID=UPI0035B5AF56
MKNSNRLNVLLIIKDTEVIFYMDTDAGVNAIFQRYQQYMSLPIVSTIKALQGMLDNYHRLLLTIDSTLASPPSDSLKDKPKIWKLDPYQRKPSNIQRKLPATIVVNFPMSTASFLISTDGSDAIVGTVLEQMIKGSLQPLVIFSRKLSNTESRL